jgi:PTH1 family peptidyl-tRNA hydrolase
MKVIVGLGNPGLQYRRTRHNLGFMVVSDLARERGIRFRRGRFECLQGEGDIGAERVLLVKPHTFMNRSGRCVAALARALKVSFSDLLVVCDDVNLELGRLRLRRGGSAGGHKGLQSIIEQLGSDQFPRLRIGVGRPRGEGDIVSHVLAGFQRSEWPVVKEAVARAVQAVETWVYYGIDEAMNRFN